VGWLDLKPANVLLNPDGYLKVSADDPRGAFLSVERGGGGWVPAGGARLRAAAPPPSPAQISDFGVAKVLEQTMGYAESQLGTARYMSPERARGPQMDPPRPAPPLGTASAPMSAACALCSVRMCVT
jgi:serine/threonine protein kinase